MMNIMFYIQDAEYIDKNKYMSEFSETRKNIKSCMRKFEHLQSYGFLNEKNYLNYLSGNKVLFCQGLKAFYDNTKIAADMDKKNHICSKRLRYVRYPLDKYLESQYYIYRILVKLGTQIKSINRENILPTCTKDFICFDAEVCYLLDFASDQLKGAWKITNKNAILELINWFDSVFENAQDIADYFEPEKAILENLKEYGIL